MSGRAIQINSTASRGKNAPNITNRQPIVESSLSFRSVPRGLPTDRVGCEPMRSTAHRQPGAPAPPAERVQAPCRRTEADGTLMEQRNVRPSDTFATG